MRHRIIFSCLFLLTLPFALASCSSYNPRDIEAFTKPETTNVTFENYILQPADQIEILCSKVPEIHLQQQQIRPDGKVAFEVLGEVEAAGKTPKQLAELMRLKAMELYSLSDKNPLSINIVRYKSKAYYVLGQVVFSGPKTCTGRDTVLTALAKAQPTVLAWKEKFKVIRPSSQTNVKPKIFKLNYKKMIKQGDTSKNVLLQEGDIIYAPPTILATIGLMIEEIVSPIGRAFSTVNIVQGPPPERK